MTEKYQYCIGIEYSDLHSISIEKSGIEDLCWTAI